MAEKWFITNLLVFEKSNEPFNPKEDFALKASRIEIRDDPFELILKKKPEVTQNSITLIFSFTKEVPITNRS